jgi:hypothetical protein
MDREHLATLIERADRVSAERMAHDAGDRTVPAAREWLRRWAPTQLTLRPPACTCAAGRCAACN